MSCSNKKNGSCGTFVRYHNLFTGVVISSATILENPVLVFGIGLVAVILLLVVLKVPAFIGLVIATMIVGAATAEIPFGNVPEETATAFGETIVSVSGFVIIMFLSAIVPDPSVVTGQLFDLFVG